MPTSTRAGRAAAPRRAILDAAVTLFLTQGYPGTTTREVANRAGVSERTVLNIVSSKGEVLREVLLA